MIDESGQQYRCIVKKSLGRLVVGDKVKATQHNGQLILVETLPRENLITRQVGKTLNTQLVIASNLDYVVIVCSPMPDMQKLFYDAILIAAKQQNIQPILLLNKNDLPEFSAWQKEIKEYYQHTHFDIIELCALKPTTFAQLKQKITGKQSLFIGASGVGKSTLLNSMLGDTYAKTQELSAHNRQGKHTTSNSICYNIDARTQIIDMPGIRSFHLSSFANIETAYPELSNYWGQCQFRDCQHHKEPNCALQNAVINKEILAQRLESYLHFKSFAL